MHMFLLTLDYKFSTTQTGKGIIARCPQNWNQLLIWGLMSSGMECHVAWFKATAAPITVTDKPPLKLSWEWKLLDPLKHQYTPTTAQGVAPHQAATCQVIATGTSTTAVLLPICIVYLLTDINVLWLKMRLLKNCITYYRNNVFPKPNTKCFIIRKVLHKLWGFL